MTCLMSKEKPALTKKRKRRGLGDHHDDEEDNNNDDDDGNVGTDNENDKVSVLSLSSVCCCGSVYRSSLDECSYCSRYPTRCLGERSIENGRPKQGL